MNKLIGLDEALDKITDGATVMFGGFMGNGSPHKFIDGLVERGIKDLFLICSDTGWETYGVGKLVVNKQIRKLMASHIGLNKETGRQMTAGEMEVELVPQGTLAEKIRCGGYGLGGVLTRTGLGTLVAEGKEKIEVNGVTYLLETALRADFALIAAHTADTNGNLIYKGSTRNFNHVMASAAQTTIVEAHQVVDVGSINQDDVHTPGVFVQYVINGGAA